MLAFASLAHGFATDLGALNGGSDKPQCAPRSPLTPWSPTTAKSSAGARLRVHPLLVLQGLLWLRGANAGEWRMREASRVVRGLSPMPHPVPGTLRCGSPSSARAATTHRKRCSSRPSRSALRARVTRWTRSAGLYFGWTVQRIGTLPSARPRDRKRHGKRARCPT